MSRSVKQKVLRLLGLRTKIDYRSGFSKPTVETWKRVKRQRLTYLSDEKIASLLKVAEACELDSINGDFVEAGCAMGGSAILLCQSKATGRALHIYDVFGMIPPPTEKDDDDVHERYESIKDGDSVGIDGDQYYGYSSDLYGDVIRSFTDFGMPIEANCVELHKGLVQDTLKDESPVALAHVDVDWYEPVMTCLQQIVPRLSRGGYLVLDDYHDWSGCRKATDEYFNGLSLPGFEYFDRARHLVIKKS